MSRVLLYYTREIYINISSQINSGITVIFCPSLNTFTEGAESAFKYVSQFFHSCTYFLSYPTEGMILI